jgi:hypothetical protein
MLDRAVPSAEVWRCEQRLDLPVGEKRDQPPDESLIGHGEHALNLAAMRRRLVGHVAKKRSEGGEAKIPAARAVPSALFEIIKERRNQWFVDVFKCQRRWRPVEPLLRKGQ